MSRPAQLVVRAERDLPPLDPSWLAAQEQQALSVVQGAGRRAGTLLRRWALKSAVADLLELSATPASLRRIGVRHDAQGAPSIMVDGQEAGLEGSVSACAGWAVGLACSGLSPVGVDLELIAPQGEDFVRDWFAAGETAYVHRHREGSPERDLATTLVWSAKEAALKALGRGLFADPRTVEVSLGAVGSPQAWAPLQVAVTDGRPLPGWWRREGRFVVTTVYAVGSPTAGPPPPVGETTALARAVPVSRGSRAGG